ncbi:MAG: GNAT family N-acetyltransferase [Erythrobacter sp.]|nr:GNAT family N-acetyltransferase [Erythrobacter sp.]
MRIAPADLADPQVRDLIAYHQREMLEGSPPGLSFALDLSGLQRPDVSVWAVHVEERLAAIGALKRLGGARGEIKSMRTHPDFLRRGLAAALLETIIAQARSEQLAVLSLETGSGPMFEAALALYRRRGFVNGEAFADYALSDFNQCLHLQLG